MTFYYLWAAKIIEKLNGCVNLRLRLVLMFWHTWRTFWSLLINDLMDKTFDLRKQATATQKTTR